MDSILLAKIHVEDCKGLIESPDFQAPRWKGTECILSLTCQLKNEKVERCQCAWRRSKNVISDLTLLAVFLYPGPAHKWRWAQVLIFWRKGVELGSNSLRSIGGFLSSGSRQLCTQVSFLSFRYLWQHRTAENVVFHNSRIRNFIEWSTLETTSCDSPKDNLLK